VRGDQWHAQMRGCKGAQALEHPIRPLVWL
jgi:hypothetical protein